MALEFARSTPPSMLLAFEATNARSFRDDVAINLHATSLTEPGVAREVPWHRGGRMQHVLPVAGVFGANGSGKSNVLKAMDDMRFHVLHSFRSAFPEGGIARRKPFLLDRTRTEPTTYRIELILEGVRHDYGFTIDDHRVIEEWATHYPNGRAAVLFERTGDEISVGHTDRAKGRAITELLQPNALYLSTAASAGHPALRDLFLWFSRNLILAEADSRPFRQALTTEMLGDKDRRDKVLALLHAADLGVIGAVKHEPDPVMKERLNRAVRILRGVEGEPDGDEGPAFDELGVRLTHQASPEPIELDADDESLGTRVWFGLTGPIVQALEQGSVFLADELDASLHPALVTELIRLFQNEDTNPRRAQLIFNSHDSSLLGDAVGDRLLGRDQIWFTEKTNDGATRLYSLTSLEPRKQEAIGKRYLAGRYGGVPILSRQEFIDAARLVTADQ